MIKIRVRVRIKVRVKFKIQKNTKLQKSQNNNSPLNVTGINDIVNKTTTRESDSKLRSVSRTVTASGLIETCTIHPFDNYVIYTFRSWNLALMH
jgi:hypothetical protein